MNSADVIIIGGGIVGSSIAYHLTEAGCRDILVLERETHQGKGSTGKSMGGVRAQFATDINIRMSLYSIPFFGAFDEVMGHPSGYRPQGYLFVANTPAHMDYLRENYRHQVAAGVKAVRLLDARDVSHIAPELRHDDILGGSFCATDGFVDPYSVMTGFMPKAIERGVRLMRDTDVTGIAVDARGVAGVQTSRGFISGRTVVNAAGAWAGNVARLAGVDLPVEPLRRMLVPTEPFDKVSHQSPMVVDMNTGFHYRPEGRGLLLAWNDPDETPGFKLNFDRGFIEKVLTRGADRLPCLEEAEVNPKRAWAGLYEMTPDHHPVMGEVKQLPGFFLANGFSGHGVMHSPATGRIMADLILRGRSGLVDTDLLGLDRFASGRLLHETAVL
ncbi:MAG: FAD-binding oxidoreductase [Candidatus Solibacter sp.]|nr:FAD-binding oxidoreductase [Candidatus Solibacter sp.]